MIFVFQGYGNQLTDGQNDFLRFRRETDDFTVGVFGISELGNTEEVVFAVYQRYGQKGNRRVVIGIVEFGNQISVYTGGLKNVRRIDDFAVQRAVFGRGFAAAVFDVGQKHRRKKSHIFGSADAYVEAVDAAVFKVDVFVVADGEEKASVGVTGFACHTHYLFDDNGIIIIYQGIV